MSWLTDPHVVVVFSYAPAGLGHLRVSHALRLGLPSGSTPILLPDPAVSVQSFHRLTSTNPLGKKIMEWSQSGWAEEVFTRVYRSLLVRDAWKLEQKILDVLKQRVDLPTTVVIVATHFGIAHQVSTIKKSLERKGNVKVLLIVQVTDDSPQKMWYVPNADSIFVPSEQTKNELQTYKRSEHLAPSHIVVTPYPVSPLLAKALSGNEYDAKHTQADPRSSRRIHISVPLSGAQVGMTYASTLMKVLHHSNERFHFHIVGKRTMFSELYLSSWNGKSYATTYESHSDRQIVELYEEAFLETVFLAEITKPSEQTFKALLNPEERGGVVLLFTAPVGRQEYDNLAFLQRHGLLPNDQEQYALYDVYNHNREFTLKQLHRFETWRGLILPEDPKNAAQFISWLHKHNIFKYMLKYKHSNQSPEVANTGVKQFWKCVAETMLSV